MVQRGELRGGPDFCALIADGEDWEDDNVLRFAGDEPARHAMIDLLVGSGRAGGARLCLCAHGGAGGLAGAGGEGWVGLRMGCRCCRFRRRVGGRRAGSTRRA